MQTRTSFPAAVMQKSKLKNFLDAKVSQYNQTFFIKEDPISIPHLFTKKQDIEIAGFFSAIFAWGNRTIIINKARELMQLMEMHPYEFCLDPDAAKLKVLMKFKHRTFNATDLLYFVEFFRHHYTHYESLEDAFVMNPYETSSMGSGVVEAALINFYHYFFSLEHVPQRTKKHIANPLKKSNCKRLNMFLRWMVRKDDRGVDFGIWNKIRPAQLVCPIDVHVGRVAKRLHLLTRKQVDWNAALELTKYLRTLDPLDPVKYDFALFGLGVIEKYY